MNSADVRRKHRKYLFPAVKNYYQESVVIVEGRGSRVTDRDGRSYQEFFDGLLTAAVGHSTAEVTLAVRAQA